VAPGWQGSMSKEPRPLQTRLILGGNLLAASEARSPPVARKELRMRNRLNAVMAGAAVLLVSGLLAPPASAIPVTPDTFEDGTTMGWTVALGPGGGVHPAPPENVPTGGPAGAGDNYLLVTSVGGFGAGSRLATMNAAQWAGDYIAAGITAISMDVRNFSNIDLYLRLMFEDPIPGPPENIAFSTNPIIVPANSGWTPVLFPVIPAALTAGLGSIQEALANNTILRIYHSDIPTFPNPFVPIPSVVAQLGVDNIAAIPAVVPEPLTALLLTGGLAAVLMRRRR
jgi:hypothetical protein